MSRSIHITRRNFKGLNQSEINQQINDPDSDLEQWSKKFKIKKDTHLKRNANKSKEK